MNHGFKVYFFNISPIINPILFRKATKKNIYVGKNEKVFNNINSFVDEINLLKNSFIISFVHFNYNSNRIYRAISKANIFYAINILNCVPTKLKNRFSHFTKINKRQINIFNLIKNRLFQPKNAKFFGIKGPKLLLAGGEESTYHPQAQISNKKQKILWLHTFDYDIYLKDRNNKIKENQNLAVFVDAPSPRFKHDAHIKGIKSPLTEERYYPSLCKFFDRIESEFNVNIIICAHPKTEHEEFPSYFGGRKTIYGKTSEMIRSSKLIINRNSTSVNFAVLYNKPIIFHTSNELETNVAMSTQVHSMASWLGKVPINIDNSLDLDWDSELLVNSESYLEYKESFIKKSESKNELLWETVLKEIKGLK